MFGTHKTMKHLHSRVQNDYTSFTTSQHEMHRWLFITQSYISLASTLTRTFIFGRRVFSGTRTIVIHTHSLQHKHVQGPIFCFLVCLCVQSTISIQAPSIGHLVIAAPVTRECRPIGSATRCLTERYMHIDMALN